MCLPRTHRTVEQACNMLHSNTSLPEGLDALMAESDFLKLVSLWLMMNMLPVHQGRHHVAKAGNTTTRGGTLQSDNPAHPAEAQDPRGVGRFQGRAGRPWILGERGCSMRSKRVHEEGKEQHSLNDRKSQVVVQDRDRGVPRCCDGVHSDVIPFSVVRICAAPWRDGRLSMTKSSSQSDDRSAAWTPSSISLRRDEKGTHHRKLTLCRVVVASSFRKLSCASPNSLSPPPSSAMHECCRS